MTIAIPLQNQPDYTELLFTLRSIDKFFLGLTEVVIVGDRLPEWITNITQINVPDIKGRKQLTIKKKIYAALCYAGQVFCMHDDCYLLKHTDGISFPQYYAGTLRTHGESGAKPLMEVLRQTGKPIKNFDMHQPIMFDTRFNEIFQHFISDVIVKSAYSNFLEIEGVPVVDMKVNKKMDERDIEAGLFERDYFSSGPSGLKFVLPVLQKLFPEKSIFEI